MAYMCMGCYEIYNGDLGMCPKASCEGEVVEIDELMVPAIRLLNEKGYMTEFCCSGHVYDDGCTAYVCLDQLMSEIFEDEDIEQMKKILPETWEIEIDSFDRLNFRHVLNKDYEHEFYVDTYEDILKANSDFLHFVQQLPELDW